MSVFSIVIYGLPDNFPREWLESAISDLKKTTKESLRTDFQIESSMIDFEVSLLTKKEAEEAGIKIEKDKLKVVMKGERIPDKRRFSKRRLVEKVCLEFEGDYLDVFVGERWRDYSVDYFVNDEFFGSSDDYEEKDSWGE